jgi:hypothetical protein
LSKIIQGVKFADEFDVIAKADRPSSPKPPSGWGHRVARWHRSRR